MPDRQRSGLSHNVKVDDEVWEALQALARPFVDSTPNDVLRRVLLKSPREEDASAGAQVTNRRPGALINAIRKGDLKSGDVLICAQPRRKRKFKATVTADGWIALVAPEEGEFDKPSPALARCTGGQINGWGYWVHERSGKHLQHFRY